MLLGLISTILAGLGIYGFYSSIYILTYIGAFFVILELIIGYFSGQSKSLITIDSIIASIIGIICTNNLLIGIAIGLCFDGTIMMLLSLIMILIINKKIK